jgi:hypothetical protein
MGDIYSLFCLLVFSHGNGYTLHVLSADCEMGTLSTSVLLAWKGIHYARPYCWLRKWIHPARPYCYSGGKGYSTPCTARPVVHPSILLVVEIDTVLIRVLYTLDAYTISVGGGERDTHAVHVQTFFKRGTFLDFLNFFMYVTQHYFLCRPLDPRCRRMLGRTQDCCDFGIDSQTI